MKTITDSDHDFVCDIQAPCFASLSPEEVELVKASRTQVIFRKGDNLTKQGAFASYILFINDGLAKQYLEGDQAKSFNLHFIQAGDFVGLSSVFGQNIYNYSSVALTETRAFLIEKETIAKVVMQNGRFGFNIIKRYCEQNTNLFSSLNTVIYKQMNGRIADALLYINSLKPVYPEIFQLLSRKEIAEFAGISTESAIKLLKSFEKDGLIALHDKDVSVLDAATLEKISKRG